MSKQLRFCKICRENQTPKFYGYWPAASEDNYICPICQNRMINLNILTDDYLVIRHVSQELNFIESMIKLHDEDIVSFEEKMSTFRANDPWWQEKHNSKSATEEENRPKCPKCGSTHIQVVPRKWSFWRGLATNKTDRVCVNCNYKW